MNNGHLSQAALSRSISLKLLLCVPGVDQLGIQSREKYWAIFTLVRLKGIRSDQKLCHRGGWIIDDMKLEVEQHGTLQLSGNAKIFRAMRSRVANCMETEKSAIKEEEKCKINTPMGIYECTQRIYVP